MKVVGLQRREMMGGVTDEEPETDAAVAADDERRRQLRAKVFGDVLPESTSDDRDDLVASEELMRREWLKRQVPPHHG